MFRFHRPLLLAAICLALLAGCASAPPPPSGILSFTPDDIDATVGKWLQSMITSQPIAGRTDRPVVLFGEPQNRTDDHVDMSEFQAAFEIYGLKSGKIRFSSVKELGKDLLDQMKLQQSDLFNPDTAIKFGKMQGFPYSLHVFLFSPAEPMTVGRYHYYYYRAVLKLVNNETGLLEWSDEAKFLKVGRQAAVGW